MHVPSAHSGMFKRNFPRVIISDSDFSNKTNVCRQCLQSAYESGFLFGSKGSSAAGCKLSFELFGNHPALPYPPAATQTLTSPPPAPNLQKF